MFSVFWFIFDLYLYAFVHNLGMNKYSKLSNNNQIVNIKVYAEYTIQKMRNLKDNHALKFALHWSYWDLIIIL